MVVECYIRNTQVQVEKLHPGMWVKVESFSSPVLGLLLAESAEATDFRQKIGEPMELKQD